MKILLILCFTYLSLNPVFSSEQESEFLKFNWITQEKMPQLIKEAREREQKRGVAASEVEMSAESKKIRDELLLVKKSGELADLIDRLEARVDTLPEDAKLIASLLVLAKPLRGIVYRMIPLASEQNVTHSQLRTMVRSWASNLGLYLPYTHVDASFGYFTEPYLDNNTKQVVSQFVTGSSSALNQFQNYLSRELYPAMGKAIQRIEGLSLKNPVVWDNRMVFGANSFKGTGSTENRFRSLDEGEKNLILSSLNLGVHYLHYMIAYNVEDAFKLAMQVGKLYGLDGFLYKEVDGVPSYRIAESVKLFPSLFTLRGNGKANMEQSWNHYVEGIQRLRLAREEVKNQSSSELFVLKADLINPWGDEFEKQMSSAECFIKNPVCSIRSSITGEVVKVSLRNFYMNPPQDLKALMPNSWDITNKVFVHPTLKVTYPNYDWGRPTGWNVNAYKSYFPEVAASTDVRKFVRILRQAHGGEFFAAPFAVFVE